MTRLLSNIYLEWLCTQSCQTHHGDQSSLLLLFVGESDKPISFADPRWIQYHWKDKRIHESQVRERKSIFETPTFAFRAMLVQTHVWNKGITSKSNRTQCLKEWWLRGPIRKVDLLGLIHWIHETTTVKLLCQSSGHILFRLPTAL